MEPLNSIDARIAQHYESILDYEKIRLEQDSPIEFAITLRVLDHWIQSKAIVMDVGVGVGHYSLYLAKKGCFLHLVDIADSFLALTQQRLANENLSTQVLSSIKASAPDLKDFADESVDHILMLGPFYHILDKQRRQQAVREAYRILKKNGLLFAAGINRLALLHELFNSNRFFGDKAIGIKSMRDELEEYCRTGISNSTLFPPLSDAYCTTIDEFGKLFAPFFSQLDFLGLESFTAFNQRKIFEKDPDDVKIWLSLVEKTARTDEGRASAEHFLYVGQKKRP